MQAWILALAVLTAAAGTLGSWWQSEDDNIIMTDGANPLPPKN